MLWCIQASSCQLSLRKERVCRLFRAVPILLSILVGLLISLVVWGLVRPPRQQTGDTWIETRDDLLIGLLVLAAFVSGAFLTYVLLELSVSEDE